MTTAAEIAYRVWGDLGKIDVMEEFIATGGSTTTAVNGNIADRQERPEDNYSIDSTVIVVRDAGGANAAPEGEMQRIESYNSSTYTHTVDTAFSAAIASGDTVAVANSDIPMREMYRAINNALIKIGDIPVPVSTLTSAESQTEYTLPSSLGRGNLISVEYQGNTDDADDNDRIPILNYRVLPASSPGGSETLIIPQIDSGRTIYLIGMGAHALVTASSSSISKYIHAAVMIPAASKEVLRWYNANVAGNNNYWVQKENEAAQELEIALREHPIWMPKHTPRYSAFPILGR